MEKISLVLVALLLCTAVPRPSLAKGVSFASLRRTLIVSASPKQGQVLRAGEDTITVTWALNQSLPAGTDAAYKKIKVRLCYAPASQKDRGWRKTKDDLSKDKTCSFAITAQPYAGGDRSNFTYLVSKELPSGTFFVRAYAVDAADAELAFGQTTNAGKTENLFNVEGISGHHASLDVAAACFSAFSILALVAFYVQEKRGAKKK
ncbi:unnamed protein product [Spirodela intermedia]|uniref:High-affinity nitrate transporter n=1 Tax=Spirodela intermedia TaxID=51605 RepID=A0A7I8JD09_SPIIN|nr:unnamed protein product [Spirodela intermedia]CAA6668030.1 unnamed protein product [Spirodela intermedia]